MAFGLAVEVTNRARGQLHVSALYRRQADGRLMIGDVQWHKVTRNDEAGENPDAYWVAPDLPAEDQYILASKIKDWLERNARAIPYSVANPGGALFENDMWAGNRPAQGLTCATFIVELFDELGIDFLNKKSWVRRAGDIKWASGILNLLSTHSSTETKHLEAQRKNISSSIRIRPSDVIAAGLLIRKFAPKSGFKFHVLDPVSDATEKYLLSTGIVSFETYLRNIISTHSGRGNKGRHRPQRRRARAKRINFRKRPGARRKIRSIARLLTP